METIASQLIAALSPAALPVVIVVAIYFYFKFKSIEADRAATKASRDDDSMAIHDKLLKHDFLLTQLKDSQSLNATAVDDLRDQVSLLNTNIVKLTVIVEHLSESIKEVKK